MPRLDENRLLPVDPSSRNLARGLLESIQDLPIISPHGHVDPSWIASDAPFGNAAELFVTPDHYVLRMLYSQGISLDQLGVPRKDGTPVEVDPREVWRVFASHYHLFRGTPSKLWIDYSLEHVFGLADYLHADTADAFFDHIGSCLAAPEFRPRALFERFNIEVLATTESPLDTLEHHATVAASNMRGRMVTTYRPDNVVDPAVPGFDANLKAFAEITGQNTLSWQGYLEAHRIRRRAFIAHGATASDHGHPTARTLNLPDSEAEALFNRIASGKGSAEDAENFRAHMLCEMAKMSLDDGLVMQLHCGSRRNHSPQVFDNFGADKGFDIPGPIDYVDAFAPLLDLVGHNPDFALIVFTLDETTWGRELAPLAGVYPALKLGPAWWFFDSADGMMRFREMTTETAGFYNTVGFNDDTRAFTSIPARHDVARRVDCAYLANLVGQGRLTEPEAFDLAFELTNGLVKKAYRL
ncbi:MAG: glucuronate isomerase [Pseudomonadota bacterium]